MIDYLRSYSTNHDGVIYDDGLFPLVYEYALDKRKLKAVLKYLKLKGYAQSRKDVSQLDQQIDRFKEKHAESLITFPAYQAALSYVRKRMPRNLEGLTYSRDEDIIKALPRKDTHAGLTYILSGLKEKGENLENIFARHVVRMEEAKRNGTFQLLDLGGVRTQNSSPFNRDGTLKEGDEFPKPSKTRLIWMRDLMLIISELIYAKPLQDALAKCSWYAGGKSTRDTRIRVHQVQKYGNYWYSLDYSHFDASIPGWLIRDAFTLLRECFISVDEQLWAVIVHDFVNKALVKPDGEISISHDGIPSGDMFTQIIGSLCNYIMIVTYMLSIGDKSFDTITMGDDNLLGTGNEMNLEHIKKFLFNCFGAEINPIKVDKGTYDQPAYFLSREWRSAGEYRNPMVLIAKLFYPERERVYNAMASPADVLYSYCITFPLGMRELIDMNRFVNDYQPETKSWLGDTNARNLNGLMKFKLLYENHTVSDWANQIYTVRKLAAQADV